MTKSEVSGALGASVGAMKYGKVVEALRAKYPRFRNFYLNYKELKRTIKNMKSVVTPGAESVRSLGVSAARDGEASLADLLKTQLDKINNFVELQYEVLEGEARTRLRVDKEPREDELDELASSILDLDSFVQANFVGFRKITKKCDKKHNTCFSAWFMPRVEAASFTKTDFDMLLAQLGQLYARWRQFRSEPREQTVSGSIDETFLVPQEALMATKIHLLKHLNAGMVVGEQPARRPSLGTQVRLGLSEVVTQVYFDNTNGDQYAARHRRSGCPDQFHGGPLFRCRWSGENKGGADVDVQLDILDVDGTAVQVSLKQRDMISFLAGKLDSKAALSAGVAEPPDGLEKSWAVLQRVQTAISAGSLKPVVSATCRSCKYFLGGTSSNAATAQVEQDCTFWDEQRGGDWGSAWCPAASGVANGASEGQVVLPEAILRVRVPTGTANLRWFRELQAKSFLRVPGFSKAMHGAALLHQEIAVPAPAWMTSGVRRVPKPPAEPQLLDAGFSAPRSGVAAAGQALGGNGQQAKRPEAGPSAASGAKTSKDAPKAEPAVSRRTDRSAGAPPPGWRALGAADYRELKVDLKTPMANERTLLRWLRSAVLLSSLSAFLCSCKSDTSSQLNGLLLSGVTLLFVFWPLVVFRRRSLEYPEGQAKTGLPKADRALPQALALSLVVILSAVLAVHALFGAGVSSGGAIQDAA